MYCNITIFYCSDYKKKKDEQIDKAQRERNIHMKNVSCRSILTTKNYMDFIL